MFFLFLFKIAMCTKVPPIFQGQFQPPLWAFQNRQAPPPPPPPPPTPLPQSQQWAAASFNHQSPRQHQGQGQEYRPWDHPPRRHFRRWVIGGLTRRRAWIQSARRRQLPPCREATTRHPGQPPGRRQRPLWYRRWKSLRSRCSEALIPETQSERKNNTLRWFLELLVNWLEQITK